MANDSALTPHTSYARQHVRGTNISWNQASKILPLDPTVREAILAIECEFTRWMEDLEPRATHLPSRIRSLVWVMASAQVLQKLGEAVPQPDEVLEQLTLRSRGVLTGERENVLSLTGLKETRTPCVA